MTCRHIAYWTLAATVLTNGPQSQAHDWYPRECCSDRDCAPADVVERRDDGSYRVTLRGLTIVIPKNYNQWKLSPDGRVHVCITPSGRLLCAFRAPEV